MMIYTNKTRKFVWALAVAMVLSSAGIFATEITGDFCITKCPYADSVMWWLIGCWIC